MTNKPYESTASMIDQFIAKAKKDILESANKRDEAIFFVSSEVYDFIQGRSGGKSSANIPDRVRLMNIIRQNSDQE